MPYEIPTTEPTRIVGGDTVAWDKAIPEFSAADGWQLAYQLSGPTDLAIAWSTYVTASGSGFSIRIPKTVTNLPAGTYILTGFVTKGAERYTLLDCEGIPLRVVVQLIANPATAVNAFSADETVLAVIDAAVSGRLTADQEEFQINGRMVRHIPFKELLHLQDVYRRRIINARDPSAAFQTIEVGFGAP